MSAGGLCIVCDRALCRHEAERYAPNPQSEGPIETEAGEKMRRDAIALLTGRFQTLVASSKRYDFSSIEETVMEATGRALDALQAMAPVAPLFPTGAKDWFGATAI